MFDDCYLPGLKRKVSHITQAAQCNADIVRNGLDRGSDNCWHGSDGNFIEYKFTGPQYINQVRIIFDSDLNRKYQNMPCNYKLHEDSFYLPKTLIREYSIILTYADKTTKSIKVDDNHQRFVKHIIDDEIIAVKLVPHKTWGSETYNIFDFELI